MNSHYKNHAEIPPGAVFEDAARDALAEKCYRLVAEAVENLTVLRLGNPDETQQLENARYHASNALAALREQWSLDHP